MTNYPIVMHSVNTNLAEANQAKVRIKAAKANGQESKNGRRGTRGHRSAEGIRHSAVGGYAGIPPANNAKATNWRP